MGCTFLYQCIMRMKGGGGSRNQYRANYRCTFVLLCDYAVKLNYLIQMICCCITRN